MSGRKPTPIAERFWEKVDRSGGPDACWPWTASRHRGYGRFRVDSSGASPVQAQRFAFALATGRSIQELANAVVCHRCDNPPCCNPAHLFIGTHADNVADKIQKGRQPRGRQIPVAKLNEDDVRAIRELRTAGFSMRRISERLNVSKSNVNHVLRGDAWGWV